MFFGPEKISDGGGETIKDLPTGKERTKIRTLARILQLTSQSLQNRRRVSTHGMTKTEEQTDTSDILHENYKDDVGVRAQLWG